MNRTSLVSAFLLFVSVGLLAQQPEVPKSAESLKVPPYPSDTPWKKLINEKNASMEIVEWVPSDQTEEGIRDILTKQVYFGSNGQDPAAFVSSILRGVGQACEGARVNGPKKKRQNGYTVAYAQAYCTNQKGAAKDVDIFIKAISGHDALYVVQREFRRPAQPGAKAGAPTFSKDQSEEMKARLVAHGVAKKFLVEQVQLCPPTGGTGLCAAAEPPASTASTSSPAQESSSASPTRTASATSFVEGKTTASEVKAALGKPEHEDHNPDGRFVYLYSTQDGTIVTYLFDKQSVLTQIRGYQKK